MNNAKNNRKVPFNNSPFHELLGMIKNNAENYTPVSIIGAADNERELVARALHYTRKDVSGSFIKLDLNKINLSVNTETQYSVEKHPGLGPHTLYINKIDQYSIERQEILIDIIKTDSNVRVIFSTDQPLDDYINLGRLSKNLLAVISSSVFLIPPLRRKPFDFINLLCHLNLLHENLAHPIDSENKIYKKLCFYLWPGLEIELEKALKTISILHPEITA